MNNAAQPNQYERDLAHSFEHVIDQRVRATLATPSLQSFVTRVMEEMDPTHLIGEKQFIAYEAVVDVLLRVRDELHHTKPTASPEPTGVGAVAADVMAELLAAQRVRLTSYVVALLPPTPTEPGAAVLEHMLGEAGWTPEQVRTLARSHRALCEQLERARALIPTALDGAK